MTNKKISALSSATTPLTGSEIVPINQSNVTDSVSVANLTAGRSVSASDYVMSTGNLVPSTAAKGINFTANTPAAGMTSQLLNWYEEGTWTPNIGGNATYTAQSGKYTRIGRIIIFSGDLTINVQGTGSAGTISGLPFSAAGNNSVYVGYFSNLGVSVTSISPFVGGTSINLYGTTAASATASALGIMISGARLMFSGSYEV